MAGYTYTTLVQAIKDFTDNTESTFVSQIDNFIQNAEERILKEANLQEFRKNASASLTSGNKYLPKPSDWLYSFSLSVTDSNNDTVFLLNKDVNFLQDYWPTASDTGTPKFYADFDVSNFILAPTPDDAYDVELHYFYRPASIVTASTTWLGTNAGPALLYACLVEAYSFMKGEADMISLYSQRYLEALDRLKNLGEGNEGNDALRRGLVRRQPN